MDYTSTFFFSLNRNWQRLELVPAAAANGSSSSSSSSSSTGSSGSSGGDGAAQQDAGWQPQRWRYNVSGAVPAILHGNSRGGKERLRPSRLGERLSGACREAWQSVNGRLHRAFSTVVSVRVGYRCKLRFWPVWCRFSVPCSSP